MDWAALAAVAGIGSAVFLFLQNRQLQRDASDRRVEQLVGATLLQHFQSIIALERRAKEAEGRWMLQFTEAERIMADLRRLLEQAEVAQQAIAVEAEVASDTVDVLIGSVEKRLARAREELEWVHRKHDDLQLSLELSTHDDDHRTLRGQLQSLAHELARHRENVSQLTREYNDLLRVRGERAYRSAATESSTATDHPHDSRQTEDQDFERVGSASGSEEFDRDDNGPACSPQNDPSEE